MNTQNKNCINSYWKLHTEKEFCVSASINKHHLGSGGVENNFTNWQTLPQLLMKSSLLTHYTNVLLQRKFFEEWTCSISNTICISAISNLTVHVKQISLLYSPLELLKSQLATLYFSKKLAMMRGVSCVEKNTQF